MSTNTSSMCHMRRCRQRCDACTAALVNERDTTVAAMHCLQGRGFEELQVECKVQNQVNFIRYTSIGAREEMCVFMSSTNSS